jgi:hypothetical protein
MRKQILLPHFHIGTLLVIAVSCTIVVYSLTIYHVIAQPDSGLRTDITGQYSNPTYGINSFEIPVGWYASEGMFGDKGISVSMHPGTSDEFLQMPTGQVNETIPVMLLAVVDKAERQLRMQNGPASSLSMQCTELQPNSTSTIDGKVFNISTMKCATADQQSEGQEEQQLGIPDFSSTEVFKRYEYESPSRIYALQLTLSSDRSSQNAESNISDVKRFAPVIDKAIQSLKLNE